MREGRRKADAEKMRRQQKYEMGQNKQKADSRIHSAPLVPVIAAGSDNSPNSIPQYQHGGQPIGTQSMGSSTPNGNGRPVPNQYPMNSNRVPPLVFPHHMTPNHRMVSNPSAINPSNEQNSARIDDERDVQIALKLFFNHDIKQKGRLTAEELKNLLQNDDATHFCASAIDALINLFGASRFGTVNQQEFISLYKRVKNWRKIYVDNDINSSFTLSVSEFHNALQELGYLVPFEVSEKLFDQYAEFINQKANGKELKFDKFVESIVWLMRLTKLFRKFDSNEGGIATIHYKDFIDNVLYLGRFLPH